MSLAEITGRAILPEDVDRALAEARALMALETNRAIDRARATAMQMTALVLPPTVDHVVTPGYATPGDGGGCLMSAVGLAPSRPTDIRSADGRWWTPRPQNNWAGIDARAFGVSELILDNKAALQSAMDATAAMRCPLVISGDFASSGPLVTSTDLRMRWVGRGRLRQTAFSGSVGAFLTNVHPTDAAARVQERIRLENPHIDLSALDYTGNTTNSENALGFARGVTGLVIENARTIGARANFAAAGGIGGKGIGLDGGVTDVVIENLYAEDCYIGVWQRGKEGLFTGTSITEGASRVRLFGAHFENCPVAMGLQGRDPNENPDAAQKDMSLVAEAITYHNCGFAPHLPAGGIYRWKSAPILLGEAQNVLIRGVQGSNDPDYIAQQGGWPDAGQQVIGGGKTGEIGSVIMGWGRNILISDVQHEGDVDVIVNIARAAAIGDDTADTTGTGTGRVEGRQMDFANIRVIGAVKHYIQQDDQRQALASADLVGSLRRVSATTVTESYVAPNLDAFSGFVVEIDDEGTWASARGTVKEIAAAFDTSIPRPPAMPATIYNASPVSAPSPITLLIAAGGSDTVSRWDHGSEVRPFATFNGALVHALKAIRFTDRLARVSFAFAPGHHGGVNVGSNLKQGEERIPFTMHITSADEFDQATFDGITNGSWHPSHIYAEKVKAGYFTATRANKVTCHDIGLRSYPSVTYAFRAFDAGRLNLFGDITALEPVTYSTAFAYLQDQARISFEAGDVPSIYPKANIINPGNITSPLKWRAIGQSNVYCVQAIADEMSFATEYYVDAGSWCTNFQTGTDLAKNTAPGGPVVYSPSGNSNSSGFRKTADGYFEAWGSITRTGDIPVGNTSLLATVTLPEAASSAGWHLYLSCNNIDVTLRAAASGKTTTTCGIQSKNAAASAASATIQWFARGRLAA